VTRHILVRIFQLVPTLFLASIVIFAIIVQAPGDPAQITAGPEATPEQLAAERVRLGLDKPMAVRYAVWLSDVVRLNLGYSLLSKRPVVQMISEAFPQTLKLAVASLALSILIGFPLGIYAAIHQNSRLDAFITGFSSLGLAVPSFWLGILLILVFSVRYHWLPPSGVGDPDLGAVSNLRYLVMPVVTIAASNLAVFARFVRSAMIDALAADYVRTARAKGVGERTVVNRHALKNAMVPVVTILGIQFGRLLGGAVVTEAVFAYSGIGRLSVLSILNRDYPVVQGTLMLVVCLFLFVNLTVDLAYGYLDPRVKFEEAR
jgi:ABC-type dipeptide/oligopeptide/nickel transport system permease component